MLEELCVRNFALVDSLDLSFEDGLTVLTGETGAGKSIIVGSLSFLLGSKAGEEVIRTGCDEASVSAVIAVMENREAIDWLAARDIAADNGTVIVRRSVKSSGRSSVYIQNVPVSRADLAEFTAFLFDLHGQHSHETLLRKDTHRKFLDRFAGLEEEANAFNGVFTELAEKRKALEDSISSERNRDARIEILEYGIDEIAKANPRPGESGELEAETRKLGEYEKLLSHVNDAASSFFEDEASVLSCARTTRNGIAGASAIDATLEKISKRFEDLYFDIEDLAGEFRAYRDSLSYDPGRLETAEERLNLLFRLKKKYLPRKPSGSSPEDDILAWKTESQAELASLKNIEENRDRIRAEIAALEKDIAARSSALTAKRKEGAKLLASGITAILARLGMPNAVFAVAVLPKGGEKNAEGEKPVSLVCGPWGADDVEFMISANRGEPLKELARIASGGELSRVMLAIKTMFSVPQAGGYDYSPDTLIFDEIDTGIGGEVALSVGEYLAQMGKRKQIFCVTHLAAIAVRCDNHFKVEKKIIPGQDGGQDRTITSVFLLEQKDRRQEIARMLAGSEGEAALAHADDLLSKYRGSR